MFKSIDGVTLHVQTEGIKTGTPIVFLNSLGSSLCIWDELCELLKDNFRIIRYDKRGHGLSDCPPGPYSLRNHSDDLLGLLDSLQIESACLIGVSVGGMIALDFAAAHPQRVQTMILCDTGAKIGGEQLWNDRIAAVRSGGLEPMTQAVLARWFTTDFIQNQPDRYCGYANMFARTPAEGYAATCAALRDRDLRAIVPTIQTPALVLCGDQDLVTPPEQGQELASLLPNARFELIPGAAHLPSIEQPGLLAEKIRVFLQRDAGAWERAFEAGMKIRRAVLGDAHVDRAEANKTDFDADFQRMITEFAWGTVWNDETIDRQTRHLITIALLAGLGKEHELAMHIRATKNTGVTPEQIKQALHQVAVYAGIPAANTAFGVAKRVLAERNATPTQSD